MKSPALFWFYFCISFILMFSWMNLSKGEIIFQPPQVEKVQIDETHAPIVIRTPNIPKLQKTPVEETIVPELVAPPVEITNDTSAVENDIPKNETILEEESADVLTSAPQKIVLKVLTSNTPASFLISSYKAIIASPKFASKVTPLTLELVDNRVEPRGRMTSEMVSLVVPLTTPSESIKVFAHELGHVVDIQYLKPTRLSADYSEKYYEISWLDTSTKKPKMALTDFVSGYAMTNKYEDFGESFNYYLFHNNDFARRAKLSPILQKKYNFLKKYVFTKQEFIGTGFELDPIPAYNWDTTKIPVALNKYLFYIK